MATSAKFGEFLKSLKVGDSTAMLKFQPVHRETAVLAAGFATIIEMAFSDTESGDFMGMGVSTAFIIKALMDSNQELLELFFVGLDEDDERRETIVKVFVDLVVGMGFMVIDERALAAELEGNDGQADDAPAEPSDDGRAAELPAELEHDTGQLEEGMTSGERAEYYRMKAGDVPAPQDPADAAGPAELPAPNPDLDPELEEHDTGELEQGMAASERAAYYDRTGDIERRDDDDDEQHDGQPAIGRPGSDIGSTGPGENDSDEISGVDHEARPPDL